MTYAEFVLDFFTFGPLFLAVFGLGYALVTYFCVKRPMRRLAEAEARAREAAEREPLDGEEVPSYPKKTSASA